jgi:hypothetical protein
MTQGLPHSKLSARFEARAHGRGHAREERGIYAASTFHYEEIHSISIALGDGMLMRAEARAPFAVGHHATAALRSFSSSPA